MHKLRLFLFRFRYPLLLSVTAFLIFVTNYKLGTSLIGWDNLQTELDPWLAVKRAFFAGWQEYQNFGLVSGLAHSSDLIRAILMWVVSFFLPQTLERYFFHTAMLAIGGIGMYRSLRYLHLADSRPSISFLGGLFYMVNLGTVQIFALPLEAFSIFFAALPWLLWIFLKVLLPQSAQQNKKIQQNTITQFFIINLLATPAFYIQTLFIVYMLLLGCISFGLLFSKHIKRVITVAPLLAVFIIAINLFWILPQAYFISNNIDVVKEAKSNTFSTVDLFYQNQEKGTIDNFLTFQGFYIDLYSATHGLLFAPWKSFLNQETVRTIQFAIILIMFAGFFYHFKRNRYLLFGFLPVALALLSATPPFEQLNLLIRSNETLNQIFRAPFTKFIIPHAFFGSIFFATGILAIGTAIEKIYIRYKHLHGLRHVTARHLTSFTVATAFLLLLIVSVPIWKGHFYNAEVKQKIPKQYSEVMAYFKTVDKNQRIALLPDYTFWGWFFHKWGYNGSGFLWYGIEQPIVSRTFDVWSEKGESYFWEVKTAIEAEDPQQLKNVLEKYAVDYLVLDYSLIPVSSPVKGLQYDRLEEVLGSTQGVEQVKQLKDIRVYKVNHEYTAKSFVAIAESVPNIGPTVKRMSDDTAYANNKTYISTDTLPYNAYYPFLDFMTQSRQPQQNWTVTKSDQFISVSTPRAAALLDDADLYSIQTGTSSAVFHIIRDGKERQITVPVTVESKNGTVSLHFPDYKATTLNPSAVNVLSCGKSAGPITVKKIGSILQVRTNNNVWGCFTYLVGQVEQQYGYLLSVSSKNSAGKRLFFYILDRTKSQNYIEDLIQDNETYYVISPKYQYGVGYTFSFQNTSYTNTPSENTLLKMDLSYLPYSQIKNVVITEKNPNIPQARYVNAFQAKKRSYFHYEVNPGEISPGAVVLLNQTYDSGWKAYKHSSKDIFAAVFPFVGGKEVTTHVPVNNWANGWILDKDSIDPSSTIHLVFLPQYLEFAGMLIVTMLGFGLLYRAKNNN